MSPELSQARQFLLPARQWLLRLGILFILPAALWVAGCSGLTPEQKPTAVRIGVSTVSQLLGLFGPPVTVTTLSTRAVTGPDGKAPPVKQIWQYEGMIYTVQDGVVVAAEIVTDEPVKPENSEEDRPS